jgi:cytoskeletal protein RodZ
MESLGLRFKHAREAQGLSLQDIAAKTKISVALLEAVERNDFARLPAGIFGRSFVRAYAVEVGLDPDNAVSGFVDDLERGEREAAAAREAARPEITLEDQRFLDRQRQAVFWLRVVIASLIVAGVAVAGWVAREGLRPSSPAPAPDALVSPPTPDPTSSVTQRESSASGIVSGNETAAPPDSARDSGLTATSSSLPLQIDLSFSADCWISAAIDGADSKGRLYRAGESVRYSGTREVLFEIGNAGAVAMTIAGKPAKPLGKLGATLRLRVTPENMTGWLE